MSKNIPTRRTRKAENYAKKVRIEPPKATRQEEGPVNTRDRKNLWGQHDHGPPQEPKNAKNISR